MRLLCSSSNIRASGILHASDMNAANATTQLLKAMVRPFAHTPQTSHDRHQHTHSSSHAVLADARPSYAVRCRAPRTSETSALLSRHPPPSATANPTPANTSANTDINTDPARPRAIRFQSRFNRPAVRPRRYAGRRGGPVRARAYARGRGHSMARAWVRGFQILLPPATTRTGNSGLRPLRWTGRGVRLDRAGGWSGPGWDWMDGIGWMGLDGWDWTGGAGMAAGMGWIGLSVLEWTGFCWIELDRAGLCWTGLD